MIVLLSVDSIHVSYSGSFQISAVRRNLQVLGCLPIESKFLQQQHNRDIQLFSAFIFADAGRTEQAFGADSITAILRS